MPLVTATGTPRFAPPSLNCTVPAGVSTAEETIAVKVTACPDSEGLSDDAMAVVVVAFAMTRASVAAPP